LPTTSGTILTTAGGQTVPFAAGSAAAPSITFTGDTNTGIYSPAADTIAFTEGGVESMRIDSSGNVGIGTSSPVGKVDISGLNDTGGVTVLIRNTSDIGNTTPFIDLRFSQRSNGADNGRIRAGRDGIYSASGSTMDSFMAFYTAIDNADTERMRITSAGDVGIGTTTPGALLQARGQNVLSANTRYLKTWVGGASSWGANSYEELGIGYSGIRSLYTSGDNWDLTFATGTSTQFSAGTQAERMRIHSNGYITMGTTNTNIDAGPGFKFIATTNAYIGMVVESSINSQTNYHLYSTGAGAYRFYVGAGGTISATATTITAISDIRLKENIRDLEDGLNAVMALKPRKFDWKAGKGKDIKNDRGWIAQEFETVFPDMIEEWKDTPPEGEEPYKAVNANLIPTLVKAIQELNAKVEAQAAEIQALKGAK
jgi:hypothetical protein